MQQTAPKSDPAKAPGMPHEADIGSGETTPGQRDTEEQIARIPPLPERVEPGPAPGSKRPV
jgi:hypothetical protein